MSSAVISTSAALSRHFVFDEEAAEDRPLADIHKKPAAPEESIAVHAFQSAIKNQPSTIHSIGDRQSAIVNSLLPASQLAIRPTPEMASSGIAALDTLTGGLPRGCLVEICGPASSGRTTVLLAALAAATYRGEFCAVVDASDTLDPHSVAATGVDLDRLLWVRCGAGLPQKENSPRRQRSTKKNLFEKKQFQAEDRAPRKITFASEHHLTQALRATDLLLESGGFGLIVLDLADLPTQDVRRIPLVTWFRFRRAVEHKPTMLLAIEQQPIAGSCSSLRLQLGVPSSQYPAPNANPSHAQLLTAVHVHAELTHSRLDRKPARSVMFTAKTAWAG